MKFIEDFSLFRMNFLEFGTVVGASALDEIASGFTRDNRGMVVFPERFEKVRSILLRVRERAHFERILDRVRSIDHT